MTDRHIALAKLLVTGALALALIIAMSWIVLSPVSDAISKAALMVISTTVGFVFGRETRS